MVDTTARHRHAACMSSPSLAHGRLCVLLAALLWSTSGAFTRLLTSDTGLRLNEPPIEPLPLFGLRLPVQLAFYRVLFAGLLLVPALRKADITFRPAMLAMALCFAVMNILFVSALALGTSANAIFLQYTAPMWMYLACVLLLREPADRRGLLTLIIGSTGIVIIVAGGWQGGQGVVVLIALGSGVTYAGVLIGLRLLRDVSSQWLTVWNHLLGALALLPFILMVSPPTWSQLLVLFFFGTCQMGLAYWLVARGLRVVSPQEAGTITLLEPVLNPVWAYLIAPETEKLDAWTFVGGAFILAALAWRYWPRRAAD